MELFTALSQWSREGDPCVLVWRDGLYHTHMSYVRNVLDGMPHEDAVEGTRSLALSLYGDRGNGNPFWSNNERRMNGRGPMPLRRVLKYRGLFH